ncbi:MAG: PIG-L family deacetylase [Nanoarchaeota archaeon]|nr:PIG-L family deacetylase [Nanoarchaeota archaeon]
MKALFAVAHPDDEAMCGGLVKKISSDGDGSALVVCFSGAGTPRQEEFMDSCNILGAEGSILTYQELDMQRSIDREALDKLRMIIRKFKPHIVVTHFEQDYNPDHRAVSGLVYTAVEFASHGVPDKGWQTSRLLQFEVNTMIPQPDVMVCIDDEFEYKLKALEMHFSQTGAAHKEGYYTRLVTKVNELRGVQAGCRYAEAYAERKLPVVGNFYCVDRTVRGLDSLLSYPWLPGQEDKR